MHLHLILHVTESARYLIYGRKIILDFKISFFWMLSLRHFSGMRIFIIVPGQKEKKQLYEIISFRILSSSLNYLTLSSGIYYF